MQKLVLITEDELRLIISDEISKLIPVLVDKLRSDIIPDDDLLTSNQAAKVLDISLSTLHSYKRNGAIPFHRIGRKVFFKRSEIIGSLIKIN